MAPSAMANGPTEDPGFASATDPNPDVNALHDDTEACDAPESSHTASENPAVKKTALCGVCDSHPAKYKCPRCYLPYCSIACNKTHRENHPPDPEPKPNPAQHATEGQTLSAPDHANPFQVLDSSDRLQVLFRRYPDLPGQLLQIHAATLPPAISSGKPAIPTSMMRGLPQKETWNHDMGIRSGKDALRKARKAGGEEGAGIREYSELILHLLDNGNAHDDATRILQQQAADEDTKLIERLMATEKH